MTDYPAPPPPGAGPPAPYGQFQLPPGVSLAPTGRRVGAYFLGGLLAIVTLGIGYLIWGAVVWGKGSSPALRVLGMRCVDANTGQPVGWGTMAMRDIVGGIVQGILGPITAIISFVFFLSDDRHMSIPDKIGSTVVVHDPNKVLG